MNDEKKLINYKCKKCNKSFGCQITAYKLHKLNYHSSFEKRKKKFPYFCECCNIGSFSNSVWKNHIETSKHKRKVECSKK